MSAITTDSSTTIRVYSSPSEQLTSSVGTDATIAHSTPLPGPEGDYPADQDITDDLKDLKWIFPVQIKIENRNLSCYNDSYQFGEEFINEMTPYYDTEELPGFKEINITDLRNGSIEVDYIAIYYEHELQTHGNDSGVEIDAEYVHNNSLAIYYESNTTLYALDENYTVYGDEYRGSYNICVVIPVTCDENFKCTNETGDVICSSKCTYGYCGDGYCVHEEDITCWCPADPESDMWYRGERCQYSMSHSSLILIFWLVLAFILICFIVMIPCVTKVAKSSFRKDAEKAKNSKNRRETSDENNALDMVIINPRYDSNHVKTDDESTDVAENHKTDASEIRFTTDIPTYDRNEPRYNGNDVITNPSALMMNSELNQLEEDPQSPLYSPTMPVLAYEAKNMVDARNFKRLSALQNDKDARWSGHYSDIDDYNVNNFKMMIPDADY
ncbi:uncharacterized protein LOC102805695 [Saccoglossus kowalevskii]|uniref:Uncharacterized protein LOC102805695 n=1 Tax=Saccoglossus kowalevskii TaxID=10224 RepID=A0ABM0MHL8_SACKO|nr:PREDICTED: uncharacterized protein LOC102805695 [Saccoglossus kowalevskii]